MDKADLRRRIKRRFGLKQITLHYDALVHITNNIASKSESEVDLFINKLVEIFEKEKVHEKTITSSIMRKCLRLTFGKSAEINNKFNVIISKTWINEVYDPLTKTYKEIETNDENAEHCRYLRIQERATKDIELRVDMLFVEGNCNVKILGKLSRHQGGYGVEDPTGIVKISLKEVIFGSGLYFEGGIFVFSGVYRNGIFDVKNLNLPHLKPIPQIAKIQSQSFSSKEGIVFLSDVWLDDEKVMAKLHMILEGFTDVYAIVLCGSFVSPSVSVFDVPKTLEDGLRHFVNIIKFFGEKYRNTRIVIVPHAEDYPNMFTAPRPPVATTNKFDLENLYYATNPCKLEIRDQNIVIYRDNVVQKACRHALNNPPDIKDTHKLFCRTILSQNHYCPLPNFVSPKIPQMDFQFALTPMPDLVVLADNFAQYDYKPDKFNTIMNPGSFSQSGFDFAVYYPATRKVELCNCGIKE